MHDTEAVSGGREYPSHPPVIPTHVSGPLSEYAGSSRLEHCQYARRLSIGIGSCVVHWMNAVAKVQSGVEVNGKRVPVERDSDLERPSWHHREEGECRARDQDHEEG